MKEVIRVILRGREFYVTKAGWAEILKLIESSDELLFPLLVKAEAIAGEDPSQVRIITKYVN